MGIWIRDKKWRQRGTGIKIADPRQDCYFDPAQDGLVEVEYKQVVDRLLDHPHDFEIAWERHGILFDASGKVLGDQTAETTGDASEASVQWTVTPPPKPRGRPKKG